MTSVTCRSLSAFGLLLALAFQVGYAAPTYAIDEIRAAHCCEHDCDHGRSLTDASACCGLVEAAVDETVRSHVDRVAAPALDSLSVVEIPHLIATFDSSILARDDARSRGAPVFLLTRSLRL